MYQNLKSSLDRFIGKENPNASDGEAYLKSSLDRFIGQLLVCIRTPWNYLKSSLDRFIEEYQQLSYAAELSFKIQFG